MGKKQKDVLDKMKSKFMDGCKANGHDPEVCEKIWTDWEAFASYAFNKSHSTCYAFVAFQTASSKRITRPNTWLSVLTHNLERSIRSPFHGRMPADGYSGSRARRERIALRFQCQPTRTDSIRIGCGERVRENAVISIIDERTKEGPTKAFSILPNVSAARMNKKCLESLVQAGALDSLGSIRAITLFRDRSQRQRQRHREGDTFR